MPPVPFDISHPEKYDAAAWLWQACRQRGPICGNTTRAPFSTFVWLSGTITTAIDNGDGTLSFAADDEDGVAVDWAAQFTAFAALTNASAAHYAPSAWQIALFKKDDPDATNMGEIALGVARGRSDYDSTYLKVGDDGRFILNSGIAIGNFTAPSNISDYADATWGFELLRSGSGPQSGFPFFHRFPPRPNSADIDFGTITSSTASSLTDNRTDSSNFKCPKNWPAALTDGNGVWRDAVFLVGSKWTRAQISGGDSAPAPTLQFSAQASAPSGQYWIVDHGSYFNPSFALQLARFTGRKGKCWGRSNVGATPWGTNPAPPWEPGCWVGSRYTDQTLATHEPATDTITSIAKYKDSITLTLDSGDADIVVWDRIDPITAVDDTPKEDAHFNPYPWGARDIQVWIRAIFGGAKWVDPTQDYDGATAINALSMATWGELYVPANATRTTVGSVSAGVATFSGSITLPDVTPLQGAYPSLPCFWELFDSAAASKKFGTGTLTGTTLTSDGTPFSTADPTDVGLTLCVFWDDTRVYERQFRYLYPRVFAVPAIKSEEDGGGLAIPPTSDYPMVYVRNGPSANYAEFDDKGVIRETGHAFIGGEAARYVADDYFQPGPDIGASDSGLDQWYDVSYQGLPNVEAVSSFPRWEGSALSGTARAGTVPGMIVDDTQRWSLSTNPLITYTATSSGSTTTVKSSSWNDGMGSFDPSTDGRFTSTTCFGVLLPIIEASSDGTTWEAQPSTAYDPATQTFTTLPFSFDTSGKAVRFSEAEYIAGRGALAHVMEGKHLTITSGSGSTTVAITASDAHRLFYDKTKVTFTVGAGCTYRIEVIAPNSVMHYKPAHATAINGWVRPEYADADTRGEDWHGVDGESDQGMLENCPTLVKAFGLTRRWDILADGWWAERARSVDKLRWIKRSAHYDYTQTTAEDPLVGGLPVNYYIDLTTHDNDSSDIVTLYNEAWAHMGTDWTPPATSATGSTGYADNRPQAWVYENPGLSPANGVGIRAFSQFNHLISARVTGQLKSSMQPFVYTVIGSDAPNGAGFSYITGDPDEGLAADYHILGEPTSLEFDAAPLRAGGVAVQHRKWTPAGAPDTTTSASINVIVGDPSFHLGTRPATTPDDGGGGAGTVYDSFRGAIVSDECAIEKFDVEGGLTYLLT